MKNWKKQMTAVGLSASLLVTGYSAVHAEVKAPSAGKTSSVPAALENVKKQTKRIIISRCSVMIHWSSSTPSH